MMTKGNLFLYLCRQTAKIPFCYDPKIYSIPSLAKHFGESEYRIRKMMKELETDGAVCKNYVGGCDVDGHPYCWHGWSITSEVKNCALYKACEKEALAEFEQYMRECYEEYGSE